MSQCINNSAESRITRAPARGAPRRGKTASAARRCIIKRNYSSLPLINRVPLPRAGGMARHGECSQPHQWSGCCFWCPPVSPPGLACGSGWEQAGAALPWGSSEVGELVLASPNPRGARCHWKTPDPPLRHPPTEFQAKGSGWGASPRHPATSQGPALQPYGAPVSLGATSGAWGIL